MGLIANETPVVYGDNNNSKVTRKTNTKVTITKISSPFLEEIKSFAELDEDGGYAETASIQKALNFGKEILKTNLQLPILDLCESHEIAFVWRHKDRGIMTILFSKEDKIYFSCYFSTTEAVRKGHFKESNLIAKDIIEYIKSISEV